MQTGSNSLYVAALLAAFAGVAHSVLGERYILRRLFERVDLRRLYGGSDFVARTLRFAWHVTSIAWWGYALILLRLAEPGAPGAGVAWAVGATFIATGLLTLVQSRARHLAWPVFLLIGGIALSHALR